ncbi:MAG: aldo/keto reductase, partial [Planctomycetota bacterium]
PRQHEQFRADLAMVERLRALATPERSLAQAAIRFVLEHDAVSTVIPGARNAGQAESNSAAGMMGRLGVQEKALIDGVVPPGGGRKIWPA